VSLSRNVCTRLVTLCASCGAVYCNRSCLFATGRRCLWVGVWVCYHDNEIACIDPHQTGFVGKGSDHLQLIKFWSSCPHPREGGLRRGKIFWLHLQKLARSVCVSLSTFSLPLRCGITFIIFIKLVTKSEKAIPKTQFRNF